MKLNFNQKTGLISYLSNPSNWSNVFNADFFTDKKRKWDTIHTNGLKVQTSPDHAQVLVSDESTGRSLFFDKTERGHMKVTDEHGRSFIYDNSTISSQNQMVADVSPLFSAAEFGLTEKDVHAAMIDDMSSVCRFDASGNVTIFLESTGQRVDLNNDKPGVEQPSHPGRFFHQIPLNDDQVTEWEIHPAYALTFAKLVIAKDLNIEPNLYATNEIDEDKAAILLQEYLRTKYDEDWDGPEAWRPIKQDKEKVPDVMKLAEKEWSDSTEFEGYSIALPTRFFVQKTDAGYDIRTSSDAKHSIWTQGQLMNIALNNKINAVQTVSDKTSINSVLHVLGHAENTTDHLDRDWNFAVLQTGAAKKVVQLMNGVAQDNFGLDAWNYAAITIDDETCMIAMESETLEGVKAANQASHEIMAMIKDGNTDIDRLHDLLEMGADYRFIDYDQTMAGKTFADVMIQHENFELLAGMRDAQGIHPHLGEDHPDDHHPDFLI